jgi:hypothetical protein
VIHLVVWCKATHPVGLGVGQGVGQGATKLLKAQRGSHLASSAETEKVRWYGGDGAGGPATNGKTVAALTTAETAKVHSR